MHPPIASLLLSLSFAASLALATPSAADPQVEELGKPVGPVLGERVDEPVDESTSNPQLEELSDALDRRLGQRVDELLDELATAALEKQVGEVVSHRTQRVAKVHSDDGLTPCPGWRNTLVPCLVVTARSQAPASGNFSTAKP